MHMKDDLEDRTGVPAHFSSRRKFILAAAATGGAGILSAGAGADECPCELQQGYAVRAPHRDK
jgi:hypothetical protein